MEEFVELTIAALLMGFCAGLLFFKVAILPEKTNIFEIGNSLTSIENIDAP